MAPSFLTGVTLNDLEKVKKLIRQAYPRVPQISPAQLAGWVAEGDGLLLIDVRSSEEFHVSHLRGAVNLTKRLEIESALRESGPRKTILYCSVGFRSTRIAHLLSRNGVPGLTNLEGSIFQWANEGRPLYREDTRVEVVHPYGKRWAGLLKDGLASFGKRPC